MASLALTLLLIVTHWDTKPAHHMDDETEMEFTLRRHHRNSLLEANRDALLRVVGNSPLRVLVLNGAGVVRGFERAFGTCLTRRQMPAWNLSRSSGRDVVGYAYEGILDGLSDIGNTDHRVLVLGFNHNIQGSFGVSDSVVSAIGGWIARRGEAFLADSFIHT